MVCIIKSVETFATIGQYDVSDYTVPLGSANGATGGITVAGTLTQDYTRQWLIMDGHLFYIVSVNPDNGMTEITVGDPLSAFDRTLVYEEPSTNILGEYIRSLMTSEYISLSDTAYDMPYLSVTNSDTTEFAHVYPKDGLFTLESVMRDAQSRGIRIEFTYTNSGIACAISPGDTTVHPLIVGDGHTQLASETYNRTAIAKVTVISVLGYPHDYYLAVDGTVTTTVPVNRAQGEWITVKQGEDNLYDTALAAFAQNLESHKVTLYSDEELELYASVGIRLNDAVYSSRITYVGISAKDDRFIYNCGDMAVTLVDKIRSISAAADLGNISKLSELQNDVGFITAAEAPVQSVDGGTGAVDTWAQRYLGAKPISSTANDTVANWIALGTGWAWYNTSDCLHGQPATWGFLFNIVNASNSDVFQIWHTQADGPIYYRSGNNSTIWTASSWSQVMTVSDTGWISIPLAANITAATADGSEAGGGLFYRVVNGNHVYVRGGLNIGTYSGSVIQLSSTAIPAAYRPIHTAYDWAICNGRYLGRAYVSASSGHVSLSYVQLLTATSNTTSATISNFVVNIDYFLT